VKKVEMKGGAGREVEQGSTAEQGEDEREMGRIHEEYIQRGNQGVK
jgi:hypothetical protein